MRERAIVSDAELAALRAELEGRRRGEGRRRFRQALWRLTVAGTYRVKRAGDFAAALVGLVVLSPVFVAVALAVKLTSRGPVFFAQTRVGRYGRHFRFYKFRSMHVDAEARKAALLARNESADGVIFKMKDDPRVTRVGRFLRRSSLDELPQLFNVLLGDMSLVGPRPPVPTEVRAYTLEDRKRLNAIPGITGPWQVSGRSDIPFHRQVQLDKDYIRSHSLWNDVKILLKTVPAILSGRGAY